MSKIHQFKQQDVEMLSEETLYKGHFHLKKIVFQHKLFKGGISGKVTRELVVKGEAAALIAYDPKLDNVVLVEQFRIGALDPTSERSPWLLELVAGMIEEGQTAAEVAIREAEEEAGLKVEEVEHVLSVWNSPGGTSERLHIFLGLVDSRQVGGIYGLDEEDEEMLVHTISREKAYQWVCEGKIDNVISVIGLQWLELNRHKYQLDKR